MVFCCFALVKKTENLFWLMKKLYFCNPVLGNDRFRGVAQLVSVLVWGTRGREFESRHSDNKT